MKLRAFIDSSLLRDISSASAQEIAQAVHYFCFYYDIQWSILHDGSFALPHHWHSNVPATIPYPEIGMVSNVEANGRTIVLGGKEYPAALFVILGSGELNRQTIIARVEEKASSLLSQYKLSRAPAERFYELTFVANSRYPWEEVFMARQNLPPLLNLDVDEYGPFIYWRRYEYAWALAQIRFIPGLKTLDVGSLYTFVPKYLAKRGLAVTSIDIDSTFVEMQKKQAAELAHPYDVQLQDVRRTSFADAVFDQVLMISMIEHIPGNGDTRAMREMYRIVKPGGLVVITAPYDHIWAHEDTGIRPNAYLQRYYSVQSAIERLIQPPLFEVVEMEFLGGTMLEPGRFDQRMSNPTNASVICLTLRRK